MIFGEAFNSRGWCMVVGVLAITSGAACSDESPWRMAELERVPAVHPATEVDPGEGVRALYYEGLPLRGQPTRVFALYGAPAGADSNHKVPGIVLVHGGGGTAFAAWVRLWRERGYAAIAMDNTGGLPIGRTGQWQRVEGGGPGFQGVSQANQPVSDQWMYHAVADTILAHSLLRSFPEVDAGRTGITGISWGGVITCIAAGVDQRFKFAAPVYGCGFISDSPRIGVSDDGSCFVGADADPALRERWRRLWDPANYLPRVRTPMLWVSGTNDFAFTLGALNRSLLAVPNGASLSLHPRMPHGHGGPGEGPEEIRAFADQFVNTGQPLGRITEQGQSAAGVVWADYELPEGVGIKEARLYTTHDAGLWQNRWWSDFTASVDTVSRRVSARLPAGAELWFINVTDNRGLVVSTRWSRRSKN